MLKHLRPALVLIVAMTVLTGLLYPLAMTGLSEVLFPQQAHGSLIARNGIVVGSSLIGQSFAADRYFHGRPSATTAPDPKDASKTVDAPYNADNSGGSNLAPSAKALVERVEAETKALGVENPGVPVPVDLVTTSASGLDPDVTPAGAYFQVPRVAKARGLDEGQIRALVQEHVRNRLVGIFGEPYVNVLELNLALDMLASERHS